MSAQVPLDSIQSEPTYRPPQLNCDNIQENRSGCTSAVIQARQVPFPQYPYCQFIVEYYYRICNGVQEIQITRFQVAHDHPENPSAPCNQFWNDYNAAKALVPSQLAAFMMNLENQAFEYIAKLPVQTQVDIAKASNQSVPADYTCPSGTFQSRKIFGVCTQIRTYQHVNDENVLVDYRPCGSACCDYKVKICYNPVTDKVEIIETTVEPVPPNNQACATAEVPDFTDPTAYLVLDLISCSRYCEQHSPATQPQNLSGVPGTSGINK